MERLIRQLQFQAIESHPSLLILLPSHVLFSLSLGKCKKNIDIHTLSERKISTKKGASLPQSAAPKKSQENVLYSPYPCITRRVWFAPPKMFFIAFLTEAALRAFTSFS